jgi:LemA protein
VTVERYAKLKANQNFPALQNQFEGIKNPVTAERRRFNESVRAYNTAVRSVPANLVASFRGFREKPFFEAAPGSEAAPQINQRTDASGNTDDRVLCSPLAAFPGSP